MLRYPAARPRSLCHGALRGLIALAATATSLIWAPACLADAIYGGTTSKEGLWLEPIVIRSDVAGGTVSSVVIAWEADCSDNTVQPFTGELKVSTQTPGFGPPTAQLVLDSSQGGVFTAHADLSQTRGDGSTLTISTKLQGTLAPFSANGTLVGDATIKPAGGGADVTCSTGQVGWLASRGRYVFGGATAQGEPVVARFSRTRLRDLIFGWDSASCTDGSRVRLGDWLTNLRLRRGQVRARLTQPIDREDGTSLYRYSIRAKQSRRIVSGTFSVSWTRTFTSGSPTRTCNTGLVNWRALNG